MEAIHRQVDGWFSSFLHSPQYEPLTEAQKGEAPGIVRVFAEYGFRYVGMAPEQWDRSGLTECCVEVIPRKMSANLAFFQAVAPVLSAFFSFLAENRLLSNARALAKAVAELGEDIVAASEDKRSWGPAKSFVMAAQEAGVDLGDSKAMDKFMAVYNLNILARQPPAPRAPSYPAASIPAPTVPVRRSGPKAGRNDPCPCGSGKKFKRCCGR